MRLVLGSFVLAALAGAVRADTVTLKNGREVHGRLVEEKEDVIRIRSGGGIMEIKKADVATFSENENWGDYGREVPVAAKPDEPAGDKPTGDKPTGDKPAGEGGANGDVPSKDKWKWPAGLAAEKIAALTPIRDRLFKELEALGPSPEERLKMIELHAEERDTLNQLIERLDFQQQQGSANAIRRKASGRIVSELGDKAIPALCECVKQSENYWKARMGAETLSALAATDDGRWLMYHFNAPSGLLELLKNQGDAGDSPALRSQANKTLEAITKHTENWAESTEAMATPEELAAAERWGKWWPVGKDKWEREEKKKADERKAILEGLAKLAKGENPEATSDGN